MLQILRKYQKILFGIISVILFFSFAFFGSYSAIFNTGDAPKDPVVAERVDGDKISNSQIKMLSYFFETKEGKEFFEKEILQTGVAKEIYSHFEQELEPHFSEKWEKMKQFTPYKHPHSPSISAVHCWEECAPQIKELLYKIKKEKSTFDHLVKAYLLQEEFPAYLLQQELFRKQYEEKVSVDPKIYQGNFSLFGYQHVREWFSTPFLDLVSCYLINAAAQAEKMGVEVDVKNKEPKALYKTIALYKAWIQAPSLFPDLEEDFHAFAGEKAKIKEYRLPSFISEDHRYETALYLTAIYQKATLNDPLDHKISVEEIEKNFPELVFQQIDIEYQHLSESELILSVPSKEVLSWELDNWPELVARFSLPNEERKEARYAALSQLYTYKRKEIDQYAAKKIAEKKDLKKTLLSKAPIQQKSIKVSLGYSDFPFSLDPQWFFDHKPNEKYTILTLGKDLVRLRIKEKSDKQVFSLQQAIKYNILNSLLDRYLKKQWALLQKSHKDLFPPEKLFEEVKQQLCYTCFGEGINPKDYLLWLKEQIEEKKEIDPLLNVPSFDKEISRSDLAYKEAFLAQKGELIVKNRSCFLVMDKYLNEKPQFSHEGFFHEIKQLQAKHLLEKMQEKEYVFLDV